MHLLIIGAGYTGSVLARRALADGTTVTITRRDRAAAQQLAEQLGCTGIGLDLGRDKPPAADVVVCCAPPGPNPAGEIANLPTTGRLIYVSSTGVYAPGGGAWVDESWPLEPQTSSGQHRLAAERALPAHTTILRAAGIYGPGRGIEERLRAGTYRIVGDGTAHVSRIHVEDLVAAIVQATTLDIAGPINCADDDPAAIGELADQLAQALGVPPPPRVSPDTVGREIAGMLTADRKISNAKMKRELGVVLRYPSARSPATPST